MLEILLDLAKSGKEPCVVKHYAVAELVLVSSLSVRDILLSLLGLVLLSKLFLLLVFLLITVEVLADVQLKNDRQHGVVFRYCHFLDRSCADVWAALSVMPSANLLDSDPELSVLAQVLLVSF